MGKVQSSSKIENLPDLDEVKRYTSIALDDIIDNINGNLTVRDNLSMKLVSATFTASNTEIVVAHGLGRTPQGYLVASLTGAATIYDGVSENNMTNYFLRSSAVCGARILFF